MSRRSRPSYCPACALRARLVASEAIRTRYLTQGEAMNTEHRVYWEPYVNPDNLAVDITGLFGRALLKAIGIQATISDATRIEETGRTRRPFNDIRLGCLHYHTP